MPSPVMITTKEMDFFDALREVYNGKRITRLEWGDQWYVLLRNGQLQIHKPDGTFDAWAIHEIDMAGLDYIIVNQSPVTPVN